GGGGGWGEGVGGSYRRVPGWSNPLSRFARRRGRGAPPAAPACQNPPSRRAGASSAPRRGGWVGERVARRKKVGQGPGGAQPVEPGAKRRAEVVRALF